MAAEPPVAVKITSCLELAPHVQLGEVLQQVEACGSIQRLAAMEDGWVLCVVFPDFGAASDAFDRFSARGVDVDVRWMVRGRGPFTERYGYPTAAPAD